MVTGLTIRSGRIAREVYPEIEPENDGNQAQICVVGDVVYAIDELVPAEEPCLKCRCQPPGVQCETIKCIKKSGCKAIHRPNKCCPDYQCECHHEGKIYANGERLKTPPGGECKVCYCRGGEVQCAEVSCYIRTDCEGKIVPGQCCPKYDHCPPKVPSHQNEPPRQLVIEESKEVGNNNDLVITDAEPDSSEISEVFQQPPPVLRIGDKLLFLKQGELVPEKDASTPTSVITIIGAEGLQRGFEDSAEFHEVPTSIYENNSDHSLINNSNDLEPKTSESTHILSLVKHKKKSSATEKSSTILTTIDPVEENITINISTEATDVLTLEVSTDVNLIEETTNKTELPVIESAAKNYDTLLEENPAYPAIPEVMSPQHFDNNETQNTANMKRILPEIFVTENNQTFLQNVTISEIQPITETEVNVTTEENSAIFNTSAELTETNISSSTEYERSMESIEEVTDDSGENTTPKDDHASIVSSENASVEPSEGNLESVDMLKGQTNIDIDDVEMINNKTQESTIPSVKDVETINFTRTDMDIKTEKSQLPKSVGKRESSPQDEADEIFKELEAELSADNTERTQTAEEEKEESEKIFQELLEETSTPKSAKKGDKDTETLEKVTDAIAKLTLRGRKNSFDTNILGIISNFFGSQYRYDRKK
ncbi:uncharacterized protein BDFB_008180 [Asbolus verrucosus]|uniref:VWFC domain-containing protein n=1 Tax=Asbolus verrucosus TaxID=1661398 RepID=A0A482W527_ASBVE|nr:uncharacterized protein BDFB_008180 [Asbolus verrucosus]